jgi:uncharacterized Zn finger protein
VRGYDSPVAFDGDRFPEYVPAAERRRRAAAEVAKLARKGLVPSPVVIEGRDLATTFWGGAWCQHLESLADLATRLPRGRTYARNGSVVHLEIARGLVRAFVSGTELYEAEIRIRPLEPARWKAVRRACAGRIATAVELLSGKLSSAVMAVLCDRETGIFPATGELDMRCSCPDEAWLCKHLAAVLYGVGARFDRAPDLLFTLRGVDVSELVRDAGDASAITAAAGGGTAIPDEHLAEIFGIELEVSSPAASARRRRTAKPTRRKARASRRRPPR